MEGSHSPFRKDLLRGKVALISGGGSGIGFEIAQNFVSLGAFVVLMGRRQHVLQSACNNLNGTDSKNALSIVGDVRKFEDAQKAVEFTVNSFGKLDILVNGAAGNFLCPAEDLSPNGFKTVIDIDLIGSFNMSRGAFCELKKSKGTIINITATLHYHHTPWQIHASAAKAGIDSMTKSLAGEWGEYGIRVCGVAPGPIADTEGMRKLAGNYGEDAVAKTVPIGRCGKPCDIAWSVVFLVSDAASFITGDTLVVDGGHWLGWPPIFPRDMVSEYVKQRKSKL